MENTLVRQNFHQLIRVCIHFRCPWVLSRPFEQKTKVENLLGFWTMRFLLLWLRLFVRFLSFCVCWGFGFYKKGQGGTISQAGDYERSKKKALFSLNKSLLRVASPVKSPWTQREQSSLRNQLEQELPAPLGFPVPQENSERGEIRGENPCLQVFGVQKSCSAANSPLP